jgi:hypothetical protein
MTSQYFKTVHPRATLTAEGKRWIAAVRQDKRLKEPALPDRQKQALNARALFAFGVDITFAEDFRSLVKDIVFPVLLKYTRAFAPPNLTLNDIRLRGAYAQEHVHLALAKVVNSKEDYPIVEVQFESPMLMSYGITAPSTNFLLCEDGTMQYFSNGWKQWNRHVPTWEFVQFPALKVVCTGFDL